MQGGYNGFAWFRVLFLPSALGRWVGPWLTLYGSRFGTGIYQQFPSREAG